MNNPIKIHRLNVKGKYYVDQDTCLWFQACQQVAPNHFKAEEGNEDEYGSYVVKQPETPEEEALCQVAIKCCPMEAIHDDGEDLKSATHY